MTNALVDGAGWRDSGTRIARNSLLNLVGQAGLVVVAIIAVPVTLNGLGVSRFGVLSLAWVLLGYFALFDFGISRATTQMIARSYKDGARENISDIVWASLIANLTLGSIACGLLLLASPLLPHFLKGLSTAEATEAMSSFYLLTLGVPASLAMAAMRAPLEALQRFDLVNAVSIPANTLVYVVPAAAAHLGVSLPLIIAFLVVDRWAAALAYATVAWKLMPEGRHLRRPRLTVIRQLLSFGKWVTVSSILSPLLVYVDRIVVTAILGVAALTFYVAPFDAATRLWIVPASVTAALFPVFSSVKGIEGGSAVLHASAMKFLLLALAPPAFGILAFGDYLLRIWLGPEFALHSALVLRLVVVGACVNSLFQVTYALIQGAGRPDLTALAHLVEVLPYVATTYVMVQSLGLAGAALTWDARVLLDGLALLFFATHIQPTVWTTLKDAHVPASALAFAASLVAAWSCSQIESAGLRLVATVGLITTYSAFSWFRILSRAERDTIASVWLLARTSTP